MTAHRKIDSIDTENRLDHMAQGVIGKPLDRPEGPLKVTGRATYADEAHPEGMAYGVLVRSAIAKGGFDSIDEDRAMAMPGVLAVITDPRLLRNSAQGTANEAPVQNPREIAYFGQPIALVVAESYEQARHAAQNLRLDYRVEDDARFDPEADGLSLEQPKSKQFDQGDLDRAMRYAAFSIDQSYRTPSMSSAPMEPHASVAQWDGDRLTLRGIYQMLKYNRNELADSLGIDPANLQIGRAHV